MILLSTSIGAVAGRGLHTETIWPFHIIDLNCTGVERTVWECSHNGLFDEYFCPSNHDASVRCQGMKLHMSIS
jgi:deleted-in-malignant-brain-tumors protein 1